MYVIPRVCIGTYRIYLGNFTFLNYLYLSETKIKFIGLKGLTD